MPHSSSGRKLAGRAHATRRIALFVSLFAVAAGLPYVNAGAWRQEEAQQEEARPRSKSQRAVKGQANIVEGAEFVPGHVLVRFRTETAAKTAEAVSIPLRAEDGRGVIFERFGGSEMVRSLRLAKVNAARTLEAVEELASHPDVLYAEPNYIWRLKRTPNDPRYVSGEMFSLNKTSAPAAWDTTVGSRSVVVGVIDGGVDVNHTDLKPNIWVNPAEVPGNNFDDDGNGYADDVNGWDFHNRDSSVFDNEDGDDHGTHVAGTIGAKGNNGIGVTGVNWDVSIISIKALGPSGGSVSDIIDGYNYARQLRESGVNLRVLNNSYGGPGKSFAALDAITQLNAAGILFVVAAGNDARDNFNYPDYPASYDVANVIAVASTNSADTLSSFSNFGARLVSIGAPGSSVLSTTPGNTYSFFGGTSMAAPHVAGAAALVCAANTTCANSSAINSGITTTQLRGLLAFTGDRIPALEGKTTTGRRLNVANAMTSVLENDTTAPATPINFRVTGQTGRSVTLAWTAPGDDGNTGAAADYDFFFVNPTTQARTLLPTTLIPATGGTQQTAAVDVPYLNFSGTIELRTYDNAGNSSIASTSITIPANTGSDPYTVALSATPGLAPITGMSLVTGDDKYADYNLPFAFPYYGASRSNVTVSTNGALYFSAPPRRDNGDADDVPSSVQAMQGQAMIAGLWDDIDINTALRPDSGLFVTRPDASRIIFRWQGVTYLSPHVNVNFEIELRSDGTIQMRYGDNPRVFPVVGISGGEPDAYVIASHTREFVQPNQPISLSNAQTVTFSRRLVPTYTISGSVRNANGAGVPNVTLFLSGSRSAATMTNASGGYSFTGLAEGGNYTVTPSLPNATFAPPSQTFNNLGGDRTADFTATLCTFSITPNAQSFGADGGTGTVTVTTGGGCSWFASSNASWITFTSGAGATGSGTATFTVSSNSSNSGRTGTLNVAGQIFTVTQAGLACAQNQPITFGTPVNGTLTASDCNNPFPLPNGQPDNSKIDVYTFNGIAGQQVTITMNSTAFDTVLYLLDANNNILAFNDDIDQNTTNSRISLFTLPASGAYSILANSFRPFPEEQGAYTLTLTGSATCTPNSIGYGDTKQGTLSAGDCANPIDQDGTPVDFYTFNGTAGQQISITMTATSGNLDPYLYLLLPDGDLLADDDNGGGGTTARIPAGTGFGRLPVSGTYTIVANTLSASQTGGYNLTLTKAATDCASVALTVGTTANGSLANGDCRLLEDSSFIDAYTFDGTANSQVVITMTSATSGLVPVLFLLSPTGEAIGIDVNSDGDNTARLPDSGTGAFTLPTTGNYTVLANSFAPGQTGNYTLALTSNGYTVSGQVTGDGSGLSGILVRLHGPESAIMTTTTDASGNYSFVGLIGNSLYTITPDDTALYSFNGYTVHTLQPDQTVNFTGTRRTYSISGRVTTTGSMSNDATVTLTGPADFTPRVTTTQSDGSYFFFALPAGSDYTLTATRPNYTFAPPSIAVPNLLADRSGADFVGTLKKFTISGRVMSGTNGLAGVSLSLGGSASGATQTDANGNYSFSLPADGTYIITPTLADYTFAPANQQFNNLSSDQTANFTGTFNTFTISGQVGDGQSALSGVTMTLSGSQSGTTTTDASGSYSFANLPTGGNYTVTPTKQNYDFIQPFHTFTNLRGNQTGVGFTAFLKTYTISGLITDASGGLGGVTVNLTGEQSGTTTTDANGNYSFSVQATRNYTVTATKQNYTFTPPSRTFTNLSGNQTATNFTATLNIYTLSGQITGLSSGLGGATVSLSGAQAATTTTDSGGNYSFNVPAGGNYTITPTLTNYTFAPASQVFNNLSSSQAANFTATLNTFTISGRVVAGSANLGGVIITLSGSQSGTTTTDASGNYAFANLPAGANYTVTATKINYTFNPPSRTFTNLSGNQTASDFAATLNTYTISGLITGASGGLSGVMVSLSGAQAATTTTDANGNYSFSVPAGGNYTVTPSKAFYSFDPSPRTFDSITTDQTANFTATLLTFTLSGRVSQGASGLSGVTITLSGDSTAATTTDAQGNYSFNNLTGGSSLVVTPARAHYTFAPSSQSINIDGERAGINFEATPVPNTIQFTSSNYQVGEGGGRVTLTVTRDGDTSGTATVDYRITDTDTFTVGCFDRVNNQGGAYARCDFATTIGTLSFAPDEASKQITVPIIDDGHAEDSETFQLRLDNPSGATLGTTDVATVSIADNDTAVDQNPILTHPFFVRQQYLDFLSREPDTNGFNAWLGLLNGCANAFNGPLTPSGCDRIFVSGEGFFRSLEFQLKGFYVFRFYKAGFARMPEYLEVVSDMSYVAGQTAEEVYARKAQLATLFTQRAEFQTAYGGMTDAQYVAALLGRYGLTQVTAPDPAQPDGSAKVTLTSDDLTNRLSANTLTRAQVLRAVADSDAVGAAEFDNAFVGMQYYGYLRRKPDQNGFDAWLGVLRSGNVRTMVDGFLNSVEYKLRFGQP